MPDWRQEHIAVQLQSLGQTLRLGVNAETVQWAHGQLLKLTEELGALVDEQAMAGLPAPWDDPIWDVPTEVS